MTAHDLWHWCAVYTDGETLHEWETDNTHHAQAEIAWDRVSTFWLMPQTPDLQHVVVRLTPRPGDDIVFFRRRNVTYPSDAGQASETSTLHVIGVRHTMDGREWASYTFLFPDGSLIVSNDKDVTDG